MSGSRWRGAAVVAVFAMVAAACADDGTDPISAPSSTVPAEVTTTAGSPTTTVGDGPTTTGSSTTTSSSSTSTTSSTVTETTEPADVPYWTPTCAEVTGDGGASHSADPALRTFAGLGDAPTLDLVMPQVVTSAGPYGSIAATVPIPGGVLVGVYPPDGWPAADEVLYSSSLVAVDHDGTIRWRRCFGDDVETRRFAVAPASLGPEVAWVVSGAWNQPLSVLGVDLRTGADVAFPVEEEVLVGLGVRGFGDPRFLVLGPRIGDEPISGTERLLVVDTLDGSTTDVPLPRGSFGTSGGWVEVIDADPAADDFVLADRAGSTDQVTAVYVDGEWSDDPTHLRDLAPPRITETFGEPFELRLLDGAGELVWAVPGFHGISREGFRSAIADDVVVAMRCVEWDADGTCGWVGDEPPHEELVGFDLTSGEELWVRDGAHAVPVVAGNSAIVTDRVGDAVTSSGYVLIDLLTGERIGPDGAWPDGAFAQECCGGDVYVNVQRHGAVVVATNMDHVRVWYPPELTTPTVTVDLMR